MPEATMQETDRRPIVTIALLAAMADGERGPEEQEQLRQIAATAGGEDVAAVGQQIQAGQVKLDAVVGQLSGDEARRLAYEVAVCVCNADG
ncbi:MAG TPA: GTPase, partial [Candidatus Dormibacteraeota bacterium]|nr:GTPase [Candidatus Dormibacteraeota bacterium]